MGPIYLLRLDDACPTMNSFLWEKVEHILDKYRIKPLVGVIPNNKDKELEINAVNLNFWNKVKSWEQKGWMIALHGYEHVYETNEGGINPLWTRSEFAGLSLNMQRFKIRNGMSIFAQYDISPKYFFAPSHTFDNNTVIALKKESNIRFISDTIAFKPYQLDGMIYIPQQLGVFKKVILPGVWTYCLHPNSMNINSLYLLDCFLKYNLKYFLSFNDINFEKDVSEKTILDKLYSELYFFYRRLKFKL